MSQHDPGRRLCMHEPRHHYLGGGIFVCFACWAKMLTGQRPGGKLDA